MTSKSINDLCPHCYSNKNLLNDLDCYSCGTQIFENAQRSVECYERQIHNYQRDNNYNRDCDEQFWDELGIPECPLHGPHCSLYSYSWIMDKIKELNKYIKK